MKKNYYNRAMKASDPRFAKIAGRLHYERRDMVAASVASPVDETAMLRARYTDLAGKRPFMGWDAETLRKKIKDLE